LPHYYPSQGFEPAFAQSLYFVVQHAANGRCSYGSTGPATDQRTGHSVCNRISAAACSALLTPNLLRVLLPRQANG
jgi:hypothetical protein